MLDLLLPVKTIILTTNQSKSLDSGLGESCPSSAATSLEIPSTSLGSKQRRFLMRQHRVKKELEEEREGGEGERERMTRIIERTGSEPAPSTERLLSVSQVSYLTKQHSHPLTVSTSSSAPRSPSFHITSPSESSSRPLKVEEFRRASSTPQYSLSLPTSSLGSMSRDGGSGGPECRSSHCPELRQGPALGCNFCWNTIDAHGRILRRKTKYHCPECQTNLCIVPCFQQYHERQEAESSASSTRKSSVTSQLQPTIVKTSSL
ncbi:hypothetical protein M8J77_005168 [Diaphorina citri]|nr:hypothetical protein M8J77_005168 [Diaphorina citri]